MKTLQFSVAQPDGIDMLDEFYQRLVSPSMKSVDAQVNIEVVSWNDLWRFIQNETLTRTGLEVSEVGDTWLPSLVDANALRPIPEDYIASIGGKSAFPPSVWSGVSVDGNSRILSVPWLADVRVIYYWRDMLEAAGVDEAVAFSTIPNVRETMQKLRASGQSGWGAPTFTTPNNVYHINTWLRAAKADYVSKDGKKTGFCTPEGLEGITAYFKLFEYMPRTFENFVDFQRAFVKREIAAMYTGTWVWADFFEKKYPSADLEKIGIALPPGPPFLGGSNLIIWDHIAETHVEAALTLIRALVSPTIQAGLHYAKRLLPVRIEAYEQEPFVNDSHYQMLVKAMQSGQRAPFIPLWGHLEESLNMAFGLICESLKRNSFKLKEDTITRHLEPLARRFDKTLSIF